MYLCRIWRSIDLTNIIFAPFIPFYFNLDTIKKGEAVKTSPFRLPIKANILRLLKDFSRYGFG